MLNSFPQEILVEVLARISVKTLLILRCVCKAWNSIISNNPNFAQLYLQSYKYNNENRFLLSRECNSWKKHMVVRDAHTFTKVADLDATRYLKVSYVDGVLKEQLVVPRTYEEFAYLSTSDCHLVGYVDGVLLIHTYNNRVNHGQIRIILWNPSIRRVFEVPSTNTQRFTTSTNFGFGYDHVSNDHKVVVIDTRSNYSKSKVYRLRSGLWSSLKYNIHKRSYPTIPKLYLKNFSSTTNFEGAIYWLASDDMKKRARYSHLLCFDLSSEAFTCIQLPNCELKEGRKNPPKRCSSVLDRKLAIIDFSFTQQQVCVWVRDVCSTNDCYFWMKRFSVNLRVHKFFCLKENAELLFYGKSRRVLSYDFEKQELKNLGRHDRQIVEFMITYKESLVLLGGYKQGIN